MESNVSQHPSSTLMDVWDFSPPPDGRDSDLVPLMAVNRIPSYMDEEAHKLDDSDIEVLDVLRWSNKEVAEDSDVELTHTTVPANSSRQKWTTDREWRGHKRKRRSHIRLGDPDITIIDCYLPNRLHALYGSEPQFVQLDEEDDMQEMPSIVDFSSGEVDAKTSASNEADNKELLIANECPSGLPVRRIATCRTCCGELPPYVAGAISYPLSAMLRALLLQYQTWLRLSGAQDPQCCAGSAHICYLSPPNERADVIPPPSEPVSSEPLLNEIFRAHVAQWATSSEASTVYPSSLCHPALSLQDAHKLAQECPIVVRRITDEKHPCYQQCGAFAARDICVDAHEPFSLFPPSQDFPFYNADTSPTVLGAYVGAYRGALMPLAVYVDSGRGIPEVMVWQALDIMREWCAKHGHALAASDYKALYSQEYQLTLIEGPAIRSPSGARAVRSFVEPSQHRKYKCDGAKGRAIASKVESEGARVPGNVRTAWVLDARRFGGPERYLNDYRGISFAPNCVFKLVRDSEEDTPRMLIFPIRPIAAGEELLIDYGSSYIKHRLSKKQLHDQEMTSKRLLRAERDRRKNAQKLRGDAPPLPGDALTGVELYASVGVDRNWMAPNTGWDYVQMFGTLEEDGSAGVTNDQSATVDDTVVVRKRSAEWDTDSDSDSDILLPID